MEPEDITYRLYALSVVHNPPMWNVIIIRPGWTTRPEIPEPNIALPDREAAIAEAKRRVDEQLHAAVGRSIGGESSW